MVWGIKELRVVSSATEIVFKVFLCDITLHATLVLIKVNMYAEAPDHPCLLSHWDVNYFLLKTAVT